MIDAEKAIYPVERSCGWAGVSVSGFYSWRNRQLDVEVVNDEFHAHVARVFELSNGTYGYRRMVEQLGIDKIMCTRGRVRKSMARQGLVSCHPAPWRYKTEQGPGLTPQELVRRVFTAERPGVRFVGDITQTDTWEGSLFLSTMIDLFNSEVVGWSMADNYHTDLICETVRMAKRNKRVKRRGVFHSDRGSQYTSNQFQKCLRVNGLLSSMGRVGTCYDHIPAESFFATLKKELVHQTVFPTRAHAIQAVTNYIEVWYNRLRGHSSNSYQTPASIREQYFKRKTA